MLDQIRLQSRLARVHSYTPLGVPQHTPETFIAAEMPLSVWQQLRQVIQCWETAQSTAAGRAAWQQLELIQQLTQTELPGN